ncbi:MAG TPA: hypothetical protein PLN93_05785 [Vicinamibacterales bacterium]|nr:hypothetical protein [Vicinamibacterales bacterium]
MTAVVASALVRTCGCGGWTGTWFARQGAVFHVAVRPGVTVAVSAGPADAGAGRQVTLHAGDFGERYAFAPGARPFGPHPLLEAAIESVGAPAGMTIDVRVGSAVPHGASTGTSAAVCVALAGALRAPAGASLDPDDVARAAHGVEVERLGGESGQQVVRHDRAGGAGR